MTDEVATTPTEHILAGLAGENIRLAFVIDGQPSGVAFHVGTWVADGEHGEERGDSHRGGLEATLRSAYPSVHTLVSVVTPHAWSWGGFALGVPATGRPDPL